MVLQPQLEETGPESDWTRRTCLFLLGTKDSLQTGRREARLDNPAGYSGIPNNHY